MYVRNRSPCVVVGQPSFVVNVAGIQSQPLLSGDWILRLTTVYHSKGNEPERTRKRTYLVRRLVCQVTWSDSGTAGS